MTTSPANSSRLSIAIQGIQDSFRLTSLEGACAVGDLYQYDICCASKSRKIDLQALLNHAVLITLHDLTGGGKPRFLRGIISAASYLNHGREYSEYRLQVVPALWICTQKRNMRIFQDQSPNQIIACILKEHGISGDLFDDRTTAAPKRAYCTQYGESNYDFISRLMAEEGWHYHYQNTAHQQILIMADSNTAFQVKAGTESLRFEQETSRPQDEECVHWLVGRHSVTVDAIRLGDYNHEKPALSLQEISAGQQPQREHYQFPGQFTAPERGHHLSQRYLEQRQQQSRIVEMETHSIHCEAGQTMMLTHHPNPEFNQRYLIIHSQIIAEQPQSLDSGASNKPARCISRLQCIPYAKAFRMLCSFNRPLVPGPHNAIVTGPAGEEIYTDQQGRIKVQFYWDREGQGNEKTSCWLRVNQPIAGLQWGGLALPRIGQEVIVEFEHGDPDRPVMTGRVYNAQNKPPLVLPDHKTRSTLKSLSSPGGGGFHELRVEDKKGAEQILLRSEKDLDLRVIQDLKSQVNHDQHLTVGNQNAQEIGKDLHTTVGGNQNDAVGQQLSITVSQDLQLKVSGAHVIEAGNNLHIKAGSKAILQGGMSLSVKGGAGVITLDPSGVSILGPLVRINEGGGGGSAQAANPTQPGLPAEADNDAPGAKLRAASGPTIPFPSAIDFDRAKAQLAVLQEADRLGAPFVEDCPECALAAQQGAAVLGIVTAPGENAVKEEEENWVDLYYSHADGHGVAGAGYTIYDTTTNEVIQRGTLDDTGCSKVALPLDKTNIRVEYHSDPAPATEIEPTTTQQVTAPDGWVQRMMQAKGKESDSD